MSVKTTKQPAERAVSVYERTPSGWLMMEGRVGGAGPVVRSTREAAECPASKAREAVLVVDSDRAVCREVVLPEAAEAETRTMLALRLETELPYPPDAALWAWQALGEANADGGRRLLYTAVPAEDVTGPEAQMEAAGARCEVVESRAGALAELTAALVTGNGPVAAACARPDGAVLAVTEDGRLAYARRLSGGADAERVAAELEQSLQHYAAGGRERPERLLALGDPSFARTLGSEMPAAPEWLRFEAGAGEPAEVLSRYAACAGALIAAHRRLTGEPTAAPPLRTAAPRPPARPRVRRAALVAANVLLACALGWAAYGVRTARLRSVTTALESARAMLRQADVVGEEVKVLRHEKAGPPDRVDLLTAIFEAFPAGMQVSDLQMDANRRVAILGKAPSIDTAAKAAAALAESGKFADPQMARISQEKDGLMFRITCTAR